MTPKDVLQALGKQVKYLGSEYKMTAYVLRHREGKIIHQAELQDPNGNSVMIVQLERCEVSESSNLP